jgi:hypothetical protein
LAENDKNFYKKFYKRLTNIFGFLQKYKQILQKYKHFLQTFYKQNGFLQKYKKYKNNVNVIVNVIVIVGKFVSALRALTKLPSEPTAR